MNCGRGGHGRHRDGGHTVRQGLDGSAGQVRTRPRTSRDSSASRDDPPITTADDDQPPVEADRLGDRTGEREAERAGDERADQVEGVDPGELVLGDVLLDRQVPVDGEDLEPEAVHERAEQDDPQLVGERHRQREGGGQRQERGADEQPVARPPPQADQPADQEAGHQRGHREAPGRAAERVPDHDRPEHALGAAVEQVVEQRLADQQPQPGVPEHLAEPVAEVAEQRRPGALGPGVRDPEQREAGRGDRVRRGVDRDRPARTRRRRRAGRPAAKPRICGAVLEQPAQRDRGAELVRRAP